jgi:benzaldehyde dehydrogenase (NAD)
MRNLDENTITAAAISRHAQCADPRTKVLMTRLIESLHDFAREVELTEEEWATGIAFLTSVGKKCSDTRQEFILFSDTLGLSTLVCAQNNRKPKECTESTVFGPFHLENSPSRPKPDPRTAVSGGVVIARLFELAGLPAGVLHMLPGDGATGAALTSDPHIAMIQFTGSTAAGRKVGEAAGRHLKKVSLELGGKNSLIVLDDADLDIAVSNAAWGAYLHQGQVCMAAGRLLVQRDIHDRFVQKLVAKSTSLTVGNPADGDVALGPLIDTVQRDHVARAVADALHAGAKLEAGGGYRDLFFEPTVLSGVTPDNPAFNEEIFGPVAVVVQFDSDDEAIALANRTEYGLSMGIVTANVGRALRIGERLRTGLLHINDQTVGDDVVNPFGGVGASGNGTSIGGPANWEEFTQWQWMTIKGEAPLYPL